MQVDSQKTLNKQFNDTLTRFLNQRKCWLERSFLKTFGPNFVGLKNDLLKTIDLLTRAIDAANENGISFWQSSLKNHERNIEFLLPHNPGSKHYHWNAKIKALITQIKAL